MLFSLSLSNDGLLTVLSNNKPLPKVNNPNSIPSKLALIGIFLDLIFEFILKLSTRINNDKKIKIK